MAKWTEIADYAFKWGRGTRWDVQPPGWEGSPYNPVMRLMSIDNWHCNNPIISLLNAGQGIDTKNLWGGRCQGWCQFLFCNQIQFLDSQFPNSNFFKKNNSIPIPTPIPFYSFQFQFLFFAIPSQSFFKCKPCVFVYACAKSCLLNPVMARNYDQYSRTKVYSVIWTIMNWNIEAWIHLTLNS